MKTSKQKRYVVKFGGRAYVKGWLTVEANSEQEARTLAFADMREGGVVWEYDESDEDYDPRIVAVTRQ